ncbi:MULTISPECIES: TetR/AcrR family transcriptional regulator [Vibrio]|nr:TetR/AcrR family transcriptional regulator [Vibrio furnissii]ADT89109.1 transcriptional regulator, TetR family [Vibrio furnissii NCTC 11218]MCG6212815.1 TetR/AcrR family transcriptional regulator [Vibrio furnissii]MCG6217620.1 TetR/AcrR family transcriptional regulator [Vibrio furnissii]MCG6230856.1 TetR/AcrR family transcriptional regulator [Vibrio furnissii]QDC95028.1 TetR/AcrR family transcriptional regulator [Vibrio furnissii]
MARTGRPREFNRDEAVKKAMDLFWKKGFEGTSLSELRTALGHLSAASFYAAFGSKRALYQECLELYTQTCGETLSELNHEDVPAKTAIKNMLVKTINMQTSPMTPTGCMAVLSGLNCCDDNKEIEQMALSVRNDIRSALKKCVYRGIEQGEWQQDLDADSFILMIDTFINGLSIQSRDGMSREQLLDACEQFLERW